MEPTLKQAKKVLELIDQSGRPAEWIQEHLIGSGALTDLLAVDDLKEGIHRGSHRRFLGLPPLITPTFLEVLGGVMVPAINKFVAREKFFVMDISKSAYVKIACVGSDFKNLFLDKIERSVPKTTLRYAKLNMFAYDSDILKEIGHQLEETSLAHIYFLMERQLKGEGGELQTLGGANIFYVRDVFGSLRGVCVRWNSGDRGWYMHAYSVLNTVGCCGDDRIFFRA